MLGLDEKAPVRVEFNEISQKAVQKGLSHRREINLNLVDAQQARRVLERLLGYKLSPVLCKKIQSNLSAGRVQSVTLRLIVEREREIRAFKPEEYWPFWSIVKSDSGMMGGNISHEFMLLTDIGEDTIVLCPECGYRANMEAADCIVHNDPDEAMAPLEKDATYDNKTIEDLCSFVQGSAEKSAKAVVYQRNEDDSYVLVFVRGDLEVNETKLRNYLKAEVHPAVEIDHAGLVAGAIGPVNPAKGITVVYDRSLIGARNLICGANEEGYHFTGLNMDRDVPNAEYADVAKATVGGVCPKCGKHSLTIKNGIEVGNIFQLGRRYTESMGMTYDDEKGNRVNPIMGCYGIGVGRLMASVCEEHHDQYGPVWPISIAPWEIEICALRADQAHVKEEANKLYKSLMDEGYEVLFDDRTVSAGFMFSDADLLGSPVRIVISPKTLDRGVVEIVTRDKTIKEDVPIECAMQRTKEIVAELYARINSHVPESI